MLDTIFLIAAVVGGTVMVCQFVLMFLGLGDHGGDFGGDANLGGDFGVDADVAVDAIDGDHHTSWTHAADADIGHPDASRIFEILSFRSVVAAIAFFGFAGKAMLTSGVGNVPAFIVALAAGGAAMYGTYWTMCQIYKLRSDGNEDIRNALGQEASVYVAIPGKQLGMGKIQVRMQNRTVELQATTESEGPLSSGSQVVVVDILGPDKVLVAAVDEAQQATA